MEKGNAPVIVETCAAALNDLMPKEQSPGVITQNGCPDELIHRPNIPLDSKEGSMQNPQQR